MDLGHLVRAHGGQRGPAVRPTGSRGRVPSSGGRACPCLPGLAPAPGSSPSLCLNKRARLGSTVHFNSECDSWEQRNEREVYELLQMHSLPAVRGPWAGKPFFLVFKLAWKMK